MLSTVFLFALLALLAYGLERNHRHEPGIGPRPRLYGSTNVEDRDAARIHAELRAAAGG